MERVPQTTPESNVRRLLSVLDEVSDQYNKTRKISTEILGAGRITIDSNLFSRLSHTISVPEVRMCVARINPNETLRRVKIADQNNINVGSALLAEAAVVVYGYRLSIDNTEENARKFLDAAMLYTQIRSSGSSQN